MFRKTRSCMLVIGVTAAALLATATLAGCGGGIQDRSAELNEAWAAYPGSADWDMTIRGVVGQSKSVGEHDADFTIYLTTFTSKRVPGFAVYQTVDIRNGDSMDFVDRANSFFALTDDVNLFPAVEDPEGFMEWYLANMEGKFFIRLSGMSSQEGMDWRLYVSDQEPVASTVTQAWNDANTTEIPLAFDEATGEWSVK